MKRGICVALYNLQIEENDDLFKRFKYAPKDYKKVVQHYDNQVEKYLLWKDKTDITYEETRSIAHTMNYLCEQIIQTGDEKYVEKFRAFKEFKNIAINTTACKFYDEYKRSKRFNELTENGVQIVFNSQPELRRTDFN